MVYFTGDIHGSASEVVQFCKQFNLTAVDIVVILGDVGANFCLDERDIAMKTALCHLSPTILCIHGNHDKTGQHPSIHEDERRHVCLKRRSQSCLRGWRLSIRWRA